MDFNKYMQVLVFLLGRWADVFDSKGLTSC